MIYFIWDRLDNLEHIAVDNLADYMEAVLDTEQEGIQDIQAAAVQSRAAAAEEDSLVVEDSRTVEDNQAVEGSPGNQQLAAVAANSCTGCNPLAAVEQ